ncbi:IS3 family transposase [Myxococcus stipitatus]|uniref:IS3 family transposase n=1 Tax=Myxococcus stipitatus TaxID=83455 RepID=UPI003CD0380C
MPKPKPPYPPEFRARIVELARAGRTTRSLAEEFQVNTTVRNWVRQGEVDEGTRQDGLTTDEKQELARLRREVKVLREERDILSKAGGLVRTGRRRDAQEAFRFVSENQAKHAVATLCRVLGVTEAGYYAWKGRPASKRAVEDEQLTESIRGIHRMSDSTYGAPRVRAELAEEHQVKVGMRRVSRLMRAAGLVGVSRRAYCVTTRRDEVARPAANLVKRRFEASRPDELWVADITYIPTWAGFLYLAVVLDVWSRKVVGWSMATNLKAELVIAALDMAVAQRQPRDVIHHSDQGCQYTSLGFGQRCARAGVRPSMGSVGDAYDNALCESFFASLECELLDRRTFRTHSEGRMAVFQYIEGWYNLRRRHSALSYQSPANYEKRYRTAAWPTRSPGLNETGVTPVPNRV